MSQISPSKVLAEVTAAVPPACRRNVVIIGSLAAGHHFFQHDESKAVRTKDVDDMARIARHYRLFRATVDQPRKPLLRRRKPGG